MSDKEFVIDMEDDTEGHGLGGLKVVESGDADWLEDRLRKDSGKSRFRITLGDEDDTEGHGGGGTTLRLNLAATTMTPKVTRSPSTSRHARKPTPSVDACS